MSTLPGLKAIRSRNHCYPNYNPVPWIKFSQITKRLAKHNIALVFKKRKFEAKISSMIASSTAWKLMTSVGLEFNLAISGLLCSPWLLKVQTTLSSLELQDQCSCLKVTVSLRYLTFLFREFSHAYEEISVLWHSARGQVAIGLFQSSSK